MLDPDWMIGIGVRSAIAGMEAGGERSTMTSPFFLTGLDMNKPWSAETF